MSVTCVTVDKQDFKRNKCEERGDLPMKLFDDAFRTILCAQAFVKVVFGVHFHVRHNFVPVLEWM